MEKSPVCGSWGVPPGQNLCRQDWFRVFEPQNGEDEAGILLQAVARFSRKFVSRPRRPGRKEAGMAELNGRKISYYGYTGAIDSTGASRVAAALNHAVKDHCDEVQLCISSYG